ncbi:nonstructural protein [Dipodfec virus UOA04_Rod_1011]|nr:nonstructural protein [Dipodfec virus UOA04_Rod_1011]
MITLDLYTIFDRVTGGYGEVFMAHNDDDCKRKVAYSMQSNPYKADLQLFKLGTFNTEFGNISAVEKPLFLCNVLDCYSEGE